MFDVPERVAKLKAWNRPDYWPLIVLAVIAALLVIPVRYAMRRRERINGRGELAT